MAALAARLLLAWAYFTGCAYIVAGLAMLIVAAGSKDAFQWSETFISFALAASAWAVADSYRGTPWLAVGKRLRPSLRRARRRRSRTFQRAEQLLHLVRSPLDTSGLADFPGAAQGLHLFHELLVALRCPEVHVGVITGLGAGNSIGFGSHESSLPCRAGRCPSRPHELQHTAAGAAQATLRCSKSTCSQSKQERTIDERVKPD